ncbi:WD_REPEATS_REGION domain-containing protein [Caenorhabditis elegans]|uniref:WD_REPEATS_REGION domain-containing protein n=1 Tax=Caenorhabditis elegans TaxID=6239 RepID=A5Z2V7_CAEEL|nr:WD_REPEATS_REGION domain-containing protein [Caenorhabditis elegans]CAN99681.1 WD_REPEATS_REGION domain-containing protein [Caenorhabditis elegans]|eukprot:NP_001122441.1 Uncharacterized protein CELE_F02E9.10 [Caenorhabditis elegans]
MDDMMNEEGIPQATIVAKYEKAHNRSVVGIWSFRFCGQIGMLSVSHDCSKLWILQEDSSNNISLDERMVLAKWRTAIQAADISVDGKYMVAVGMNSIVYEVELVNTVKSMAFDFGYLDAVFCAVSPLKTGYVTASYSGHLNEIQHSSNEIIRQEPFPTVKQISCLKYSRDAKYLAIGQLDGAIEMLYSENFKNYHKYEVHSMRIRKIEFLPNEERFLSACDDRLIKLHSLSEFTETDPSRSTKAIRVYSAHDAPVTGLTIDEKSGGTRFASSSASSQIFIWHIEMTTPIMSITNEHTSTISALSFSPTSRHLLSGGDDAMILIYRIPGVGENTPVHVAYYPPVEQPSDITEPESSSQLAEVPSASPYDEHDQQENEPPSDYTQEGGHEYYRSHEEYDENAPAAQYQEYNPYAEPRTPPREDDEEIGNYVYNSTTEHQQNNESASPPAHEQYDPSA